MKWSAATRTWVERAVIGLRLCPFAEAVYVRQQIRYAVSQAQDSEALLDDLEARVADPGGDAFRGRGYHVAHPPAGPHRLPRLQRFYRRRRCRHRESSGLRGVLQIASFHPAYQFAGTTTHDVTNYTNRSPYPMLQLLREVSMNRAVAAFPEAQKIYQKNIETMRRLGVSGWEALCLGAPTARGR